MDGEVDPHRETRECQQPGHAGEARQAVSPDAREGAAHDERQVDQHGDDEAVEQRGAQSHAAAGELEFLGVLDDV